MGSGRRRFIKSAAMIGAGSVLARKQVFPALHLFGEPEIKFGICTSIKNGDILLKAGYDYIEEGVGGFLVPLEPEEAFLSRFELLKKYPIPVEACNSFLPASLKSVGSEIHHDKILEYCDTAFRRAEKTGIRIITFGSSGSRNIPDGFPPEEARKQFISLGQKMGPLAEKYKITVSVESLNKKECNFINTVYEGGEIVGEVNHPNFRLTADIYHMLMENESWESILKYGELLRHVHIAEKEGRAAPGTHGETLVPYLSALKKIRYNGRISIECQWENLENQAKPALESLRKQLQES